MIVNHDCDSEGSDDAQDARVEADNESGVLADARLAERCLAGEVPAWEELYAQCHDPLVAAIKQMIAPAGVDGSMIDEMAAQVWYALVANDGELLAKYDARRGARLITYLRAVAKSQVRRHFRAEWRRRKHERNAVRERPEGVLGDPLLAADSMTEFFGTLTPRELEFCRNYLLAESPGGGKPAFSSANVWQLTHRVYRKLLKFLGQGE